VQLVFCILALQEKGEASGNTQHRESSSLQPIREHQRASKREEEEKEGDKRGDLAIDQDGFVPKVLMLQIHIFGIYNLRSIII